MQRTEAIIGLILLVSLGGAVAGAPEPPLELQVSNEDATLLQVNSDVGVTAMIKKHADEDVDESLRGSLADASSTSWVPSCKWASHEVKYSSGHAAGDSTRYLLETAKRVCMELGPDTCKAVTCLPDNTCTVRKSPSLSASPTGETTYVPTSSCFCSWVPHRVKYSSGHADGHSTKYPLEAAKDKCTELGSGICKAVTCRPWHSCTVRGSTSLSASPTDETTYKPTPSCYVSSCKWTPHRVKYSGGHAGGHSTKYTVEEAKDKCIEMGSATCKGVTCLPDGTCTVRGSKELKASPTDETTYVPAAGCFEAM